MSTLNGSNILLQSTLYILSSGDRSQVLHARQAVLAAAKRDGVSEHMQLFGDLLESYRSYLNRLVANRLQGALARRLDPSDIVQETMLAAHRDFNAFRGSSTAELAAWLKKILLNKLSSNVSRHYKLKRDIRRDVSIEQPSCEGSNRVSPKQLVARTPSPSATVDKQEKWSAIENALERLPRRYAEIVRLRDYARASYQEIALQLEISANTARSLHVRAIGRLRKIVKQRSNL